MSCSRNTTPLRVERIAILRFENLGMDTSTDWMGRALSEILTTELTASPALDPVPSSTMHALNPTLGARPISVPGISAERTLALASGAGRIAYGDYAVRGSRLDAKLTIEDVRTGKMVEVLESSSAAGDVVGAASGLARQLSPQAQSYGTRNAEAVKAFVAAIEAGAGPTVAPALEAAIAADPDFGPPYRLLAQWKAQQRDREGALHLLEQALARGNGIPAVERASIELEAATLREDSAARARALQTLAQLQPRDPKTWRTLGDMALGKRDYPLAMQAFRKSLELEPGNGATWNQLGYAMAYSGDLSGALDALHRYQALQPDSSDPIDSQGDVELLMGHLREAEALYLQAARKPQRNSGTPDLYKAAMARLMTGDVPGADTLARQYLDARRAQRDPLTEFAAAEWQWVSGRRKEAYRQLEAIAPSAASPEVRSNAYAELAIWSLFLGDRAGAAQLLQKAVPPTAIGILARFLTEPPATPEEWPARAERMFPNPSTRDTVTAYALVLNQQFAAAEPLLKRVYDRSSTASDDIPRILLAWTRLESGSAPDAALLRMNPVPELNGPGALISFYFPRIFYLRAVAAQKEGKPDVARGNFRLFVQLSGPDPLVWGEEAKAAAAAGAR